VCEKLIRSRNRKEAQSGIRWGNRSLTVAARSTWSHLHTRCKQLSRGRGARTVNCAVGRFAVSLRSDLEEVVDDFVALYPPGSSATCGAPQVIRLEVVSGKRSRTGRRLYRVYADGQEVGGWRPKNAVFPVLEWGINLRIMATRPEYLQLHAASMSCRGNGFIFAGESGCGKSTLAATLMSRGWQYFCDEFALISPEALTLQPFPKALCIKEGSYPVARGLGLRFARRRDYLKELKGRVGYIDPRQTGHDAIASPASVRAVVFPRYAAAEPPRLEPISRARAAVELFRCCFNRQAFSDGGLGVLSGVVRQSRCFRLTVGGADETVALLESCLAHSDARAMASSSAAKVAIARPAPAPADRRRLATRRDMLRAGAKLAYVTPAVLTLSVTDICVAGSNPSALCSTGLPAGELCETDTDCCSGQCSLGVCE